MSAGDPVRVALQAARRRLAWKTAARRAGWLLLGGVLSLELGLAALPLAAPLGWLGVVLSASLAVLALREVVSGPRPSTRLAAEVLDARLGRGAVMASAAEVLEGSHRRFGPRVLAAADAALEGVDSSRLLPLSVPPSLVLGAAATLLLPFLLPSLDGGPALAEAQELPTLLEAEAAAGGGEVAPTDGGDTPLPPAYVPEVGALSAEQRGDALPIDVLDALRTRLGELASKLPPADTGDATNGGALGASSPEGDAVDAALGSGDVARILAALEQLAEAAGRGDRAAAAKIAELAEGLGAPGAGGSSVDSVPSVPDKTVPAVDGAVGGELKLPPDFARACDRYFS